MMFTMSDSLLGDTDPFRKEGSSSQSNRLSCCNLRDWQSMAGLQRTCPVVGEKHGNPEAAPEPGIAEGSSVPLPIPLRACSKLPAPGFP